MTIYTLIQSRAGSTEF